MMLMLVVVVMMMMMVVMVMMAVSYTHLDVYKRQGLRPSRSSGDDGE